MSLNKILAVLFLSCDLSCSQPCGLSSQVRNGAVQKVTDKVSLFSSSLPTYLFDTFVALPIQFQDVSKKVNTYSSSGFLGREWANYS